MAEVVEVDGMNYKSAITMFIEALRACALYKKSETKCPSKHMAMIAKVDRYAEVEEANRSKKAGRRRTRLKTLGR